MAVLQDKSLTKALVGVGAAAGKAVKGNRQVVPQLLDLGLRLSILVAVVDGMAEDNSGLADLRDQIAAELDRPFDDVQWEATAWRSLSEAVDRTLPLALQLAPAIKSLATMGDPGRYLPQTAQQISLAAVAAAAQFGNVLRRAWQWGGFGVDAAVADAEEAAADLPKLITRLYLSQAVVYPQLAALGTMRQQLVDQKTASGRNPYGLDPTTDPAVTASLSDLGIASVVPGGTEWVVLKQLTDSYEQLRTLVDNHQPGADAEVLAFQRRIQVVTATLSALSLEESLWRFRDSTLLITMRPKFTDYYNRLLPILGGLHNGYSSQIASQQIDAVAALRLLSTDSDLESDTDTAITVLTIASTVEEVLVQAAIVVAAAYTAGAAAAVAEVAITALVGDATLGGVVTWAAVGSFAVEQVTLTWFSRSARGLLFGEDPATAFSQELLWNALGAGFGKAAKLGCGGLFSKLRVEWPAGADALEYVVEQVSMYGFGQAQAFVLTGRWPTGSEAGRAALDQVVQLGLTALTGRLGKRLSERKPGLGIPAADLAAADQRNLDLAALVTKVDERTATTDEQLSLPAKIEQVRNAEVALVKQLPESPAKTAALDEYTAEVSAIEVRMALLGIEAGLALPGKNPAASPLGPGTIAVTAEGQPVVDTIVQLREGTLTDGPEGTALQTAALPTGEKFFVEPAGRTAPVPAPEALGPASIEAQQVADLTEFGVDGLTNLQRLFGKVKVESILQAVRDTNDHQGSLSAFLRLLAHPDFATLNQGRVAAERLTAIGTSPQLRDFASLYGPKLALALYSKLKFGGSRTGAAELKEFARAESLIEATPEAQRAALIDSLIAADADTVRNLLKDVEPAEEKPVPVDAQTAGVNPASKQWKAAYGRLLATDPNLSVDVLRARASVEQMVELAQAGRYRSGRVAYKTQQGILLKLDQYCIDAGYNPNGMVGEWNNVYGAVVEAMLLPRGAATKKVFYRAKPGDPVILTKDGIPLRRKGVTLPDGWQEINKVGIQTEIKGNRIHTVLVDALAIARGHLKDAIGDSGNIPVGSEIQIHYFHIPTEQVQQQMIAIFSAAGSPINRVRFGDGGWITIHPAPTP